MQDLYLNPGDICHLEYWKYALFPALLVFKVANFFLGQSIIDIIILVPSTLHAFGDLDHWWNGPHWMDDVEVILDWWSYPSIFYLFPWWIWIIGIYFLTFIFWPLTYWWFMIQPSEALVLVHLWCAHHINNVDNWIVLSICQTVQTFRTSMSYICGKNQIILSYILTILHVSIFSPWMVCARIQICFIYLFIWNGIICWFLLLNKTLARSDLSSYALTLGATRGQERGRLDWMVKLLSSPFLYELEERNCANY